ncbi:amino acid permease [Corynebacterium phage CL31]|nr:amino acid permease [Corynebacterium phage CL31]
MAHEVEHGVAPRRAGATPASPTTPQHLHNSARLVIRSAYSESKQTVGHGDHGRDRKCTGL